MPDDVKNSANKKETALTEVPKGTSHIKMPEITIPVNSKFFLMVEKESNRSSIHSALSIGYIDQEGNPKRLAKIGKQVWNDSFYSMIFKGVDAAIVTEPIAGKSKKIISYQAYDISLEQYKDFINIMSVLKTRQMEYYSSPSSPVKEEEYKHNLVELLKNNMAAYLPEKPQNGNITFKYQPIQDIATDKIDSKNEIDEMFLGEASRTHIIGGTSCRTTAIDFGSKIVKGIEKFMNRFFGFNMNYTTKFENGSFDKNNFFVLPQPPASNEQHLNKETKQVIDKIYAKLCDIPKHHVNDENTHKKFDALKYLYLKIADHPHQMSIKELSHCIAESQDKNKNIIEKFRGLGLLSNFRETSTQALYKELLASFRSNEPEVKPEVKLDIISSNNKV